jgi:viologen exporter family transport system permease protein
VTALAGLPRLAAVAVRVSFAARAAYRWDFLLSALVALALEAVTPVVTLLIYGMGSSFPGWSAAEALLIQGTFLLARGIAFPCFFGMVWSVFEGVREGTFELTLLKPRSPLLVTLATSFDVEGLTRLVGGAVLVGLALARLPAPGLSHLLLYAALLVLSVAVLFGFALLMAGSLFVWVGNGRVFEVMESALLFAQYPGSIYGRAFQVVLAVIVPVGMIAFLPAQALLGRAGPLTLASAVASCAFVGGALLLWRAMLRRYASGGG